MSLLGVEKARTGSAARSPGLEAVVVTLAANPSIRALEEHREVGAHFSAGAIRPGRREWHSIRLPPRPRPRARSPSGFGLRSSGLGASACHVRSAPRSRRGRSDHRSGQDGSGTPLDRIAGEEALEKLPHLTPARGRRDTPGPARDWLPLTLAFDRSQYAEIYDPRSRLQAFAHTENVAIRMADVHLANVPRHVRRRPGHLYPLGETFVVN